MKRNMSFWLVLVFSAIVLSGCAQQLTHSIIKSGMTSYKEVSRSMPGLNTDYGRVIVYFQHHGLVPMTTVSFKIDDYPYACPLYNESFQYDDLPAGSHTVRVKYKNNSANLSLAVQSGETMYVEISDTANSVQEVVTGGANVGPISLRIVDQQSALKVLPDFVSYIRRPKSMSCLAQQLQNVYIH
jgi:hypothetical protein